MLDSRGGTCADPYNPTKYNIVLNVNKINTESQMSWVKTILHEAFHANLMQKSYELFGNPEIALWLKKPEEMTLEELMDQMELKVQTQPALGILHHEFMAEGINSIKNGLKAFSLANNLASVHGTFTDYNFIGLAYDGLYSTSYYQKLTKNADGSSKMVDFFGTLTALNSLYTTGGNNLQNDSTIPCN